MKYLVVLVMLGLAGCATRSAPTAVASKAMSYQEISSIKLNNNDCNRINQLVEMYEQQLRLRGLVNVNPEDLNEADRKYNASARIGIWSLRIGCSNPLRYNHL